MFLGSKVPSWRIAFGLVGLAEWRGASAERSPGPVGAGTSRDPPADRPMHVNGDPGIMYFHYNHDSQMSILPVRFAWSKVIPRGGCFDGLSDLDEIFPSVKTDLNSDRRISPSSVGKYVNGIRGIVYFHYNHDFQMSTLPVRFAWSKVISRGGCFDGLSDLDEILSLIHI